MFAESSITSSRLLSITTLLLLLIFGFTAFVFADALAWMFKAWTTKEEYSHGTMIPFVSAYLLWQRKEHLVWVNNDRNWIGLLLILTGLGGFIIADLATVYVALIIAFMLVLYGAAILLIGLSQFKKLAGPFFILIFMVPLPNFIYNNLSSELQLISSEIGVFIIRLFDISVYLEGNVIDLGAYKLQVVEACSGLRYLFPLVALGFILAYLSQIKLWMKVIIFLSTIPITVIMNSIRIGAIGVTVEYWGPEMAEGLLHDIEGWFMFMASLGVLLLELKVLLILVGEKRNISAIFSFDAPVAKAQTLEDRKKIKAPIFLMSLATTALVLSLVFSLSYAKNEEHSPSRLKFNHFPLLLGEWMGSPDTLDSIYIDALKFDDYLIANYRKNDDFINFYIAYYGSQSKGESAHSPRSCIPGGGWRITSFEQVHLDDMYLNSQALMANRAVIQKGEARQVVYYWFQQRGRIITNEYLVKWYLFWDALTINRTDGALVRLTVPLEKTASLDEADKIVSDFIQEAQYKMNDFIPN